MIPNWTAEAEKDRQPIRAERIAPAHRPANDVFYITVTSLLTLSNDSVNLIPLRGSELPRHYHSAAF